MNSDWRRLGLSALAFFLLSVGPFLIPARGDAQVPLTEMSPLRGIQVSLLVSLGDEDGPGAIGRPVAVEQRRNGEWVVADGQNSEFVNFFTPAGKWLRTLGELESIGV